MGLARGQAASERTRRRIRRPPAHWSLLAFLFFVLLALVLLQGLTVLSNGRSATASAGQASSGSGLRLPVLLERSGRLKSSGAVPPRTVVLTFDDGPDPRFTPQIARVLRRFHVPATFFVIGSRVVRYPEIARRLVRDGFELGNHTFTHVNPAVLPGWESRLEVDLTDTAIAGATGRRARLFRPPYSSTPLSVTPAQRRAYTALARRGFAVVLSTIDTRDWSRPGTGAIVRAAIPGRGRGAIVLMHDGGGDRSQTVRAVERLVPALRARGYRFATVRSLIGAGPAVVEPAATPVERLRGHLLATSLAVARVVTALLAVLLATAAALAVVRAGILAAFARRHVRRVRGAAVEGPFEPAVSVVVPAFNESVAIERCVRSIASSDYQELEVIVVDDGSDDDTAGIVAGLGLDSVRVLRQANRGKASALNRGVSAVRHPLVVTVDADTVFEPGTLRELVQPFRDARVGAVAGNTKVGNRSGLLGWWQHIEYVMGFNLDRRLYDVLNCMPTVPGAIGAFRRQALDAIGPISAATLAEDTDMTIAIGRAGWRVVFAERARAWTEAPATLGALWRQRYRWSYGTMQAVWKHKAAVFERGHTKIGRRGLPYLVLFQVLLPLLAPLIDLFAIYGLLFLDPVPVALYWAAFNGLQLALGAYAFRLDRESMRPLLTMPLQQFVYRQLMYLVVIESVISAILGTRLRWQHLDRTGEVEVVAPR